MKNKLFNKVAEAGKRLGLWFKTQSPVARKDWLLVALLILTNIYVWTGLRVYWAIYKQKNTSIIETAVKFYPLPAGRVGTTVVPLSRFWRDAQAVQQYVQVSGTADRYQNVEINDQVMTRLARAAAVRRLADRYGISVTQDEVDAAYEATAAEEQDLLERNLEQYYGFTPGDFKVWIRETLLERKVSDQVPRKRHLLHILYSVDAGAPTSDDERMKKLAEDAVVKLRGGQDFGELAKQESNDATSRDQGGDIGWLTRGTAENPLIDAAFEQVAFSCPLNEVTGPIRGTRGWHVILAKEESGHLDGSLDGVVAQELATAGYVTYLEDL